MDKKAKIAIFSALFLVAILVVGIAIAAPKAKPACNDGKDNDGDTYTDWPNDPGCSSKADTSELNLNIECDDGSDNDGDSAIDYPDDAGCSSPTDNDETNCGDGVCEGPETQENCPQDCGEPDSCSDTDGGNVITVFGTVSGYFNNTPYSNDDYCVDASIILEYYCSGSYKQNQQQSCGTDGYLGNNYCMNNSVYKDWRDYYCSGGECDHTDTPTLQETCQYGCTNGTCNSPPNSCSDTDGGFVVTLQGTVSGYYGGNPYSYDDYCLGGNMSNWVQEYYCTGNQWTTYGYNCLYSNLTTCSNGACVQKNFFNFFFF